MTFSKSFGYALRGILYVALQKDEHIHIDEMAHRLSVPRHFLAKVMHRIANKGIVNSMKGPNGGFSANDRTYKTSLLDLVEAIEGLEQFDSCVLGLKKCSPANPCPLHSQVEEYKKEWLTILDRTNIDSLLKKDTPDFIKSIAVI